VGGSPRAGWHPPHWPASVPLTHTHPRPRPSCAARTCIRCTWTRHALVLALLYRPRSLSHSPGLVGIRTRRPCPDCPPRGVVVFVVMDAMRAPLSSVAVAPVVALCARSRSADRKGWDLPHACPPSSSLLLLPPSPSFFSLLLYPRMCCEPIIRLVFVVVHWRWWWCSSWQRSGCGNAVTMAFGRVHRQRVFKGAGGRCGGGTQWWRCMMTRVTIWSLCGRTRPHLMLMRSGGGTVRLYPPVPVTP
jgi:hypothetical protein